MRHNRGGYTIVEVMIVLAVSGVLMVGAIVAFQGQQGRTFFSQTLFDLASRIQSDASDVSSGVYNDATNYGCSVSSPLTPPVLTAGGTSNSGCLFLGKAVQVDKDNSNLYVYTVLGHRQDSAGNIVTKFDSARPEPAQDAGGSWLLTDTYKLPTNMIFTRSNITPLSGADVDKYLIGLYIDLAGQSTTGGATALVTRGYGLVAGAAPNSPEVKTCIEQTAVGCTTPVQAQKWRLCVKDGSSYGSVTVESGTNGVSTRVNSQETSSSC